MNPLSNLIAEAEKGCGRTIKIPGGTLMCGLSAFDISDDVQEYKKIWLCDECNGKRSMAQSCAKIHEDEMAKMLDRLDATIVKLFDPIKTDVQSGEYAILMILRKEIENLKTEGENDNNQHQGGTLK